MASITLIFMEMETVRAKSKVEKGYKEHGKSVRKLECIGHVQKKMGTALRQ